MNGQGGVRNPRRHGLEVTTRRCEGAPSGRRRVPVARGRSRGGRKASSATARRRPKPFRRSEQGYDEADTCKTIVAFELRDGGRRATREPPVTRARPSTATVQSQPASSAACAVRRFPEHGEVLAISEWSRIADRRSSTGSYDRRRHGRLLQRRDTARQVACAPKSSGGRSCVPSPRDFRTAEDAVPSKSQ